MSLLRLLVAVCFCFVTCESFAENWAQFRGPKGNAISNENGLPLNWSSTENITWKTPLAGHGASSPIIFGDRIFLTEFTGYGLDADEPGDKSKLRLHVLAIDRKMGKSIWNKSIAASEREQRLTRRVADHGYATSTPVTDGEAVYAFFGVSGVVAFDWDGKQMWTAEVGTKTRGFGSASSPVLFEDLLIVNASIESGTVFAFDKKTGKQVWKIEDINRAWTSPCIAKTAGGESELVINQKDYIYGFDPKTGKKLWTCEGIHDYVVPVPVHHNGIVYMLGGRSNRCLAVRLGGRGDVSESHKLWEVNTGANVTSPVYHEGHIYWASDKAVVCCLDAADGEIAFRKRLPARGRIYASIILGDGKLYITTRDKGVVVLEAKPEYTELAQNQFEEDESMLNASPAVSGGKLYFRTNSFLYCVGR